MPLHCSVFHFDIPKCKNRRGMCPRDGRRDLYNSDGHIPPSHSPRGFGCALSPRCQIGDRVLGIVRLHGCALCSAARFPDRGRQQIRFVFLRFDARCVRAGNRDKARDRTRGLWGMLCGLVSVAVLSKSDKNQLPLVQPDWLCGGYRHSMLLSWTGRRIEVAAGVETL